MQQDIYNLLDNPLLLLAVMLVGALIGIAVERLIEGQRRVARRTYWERKRAQLPENLTALGNRRGLSLAFERSQEAYVDAAEQLRRVMRASFKARALLNKSERRLLSVIDQTLAADSPGWRAMGQVNLGEILSSEDKEAFMAINAKRVDLLIVDDDCRPLHAIEFQGTGHHISDETAARDAVKKEALRRAGIGYIEVVSGDTPAQVRDRIRTLIGKSAS